MTLCRLQATSWSIKVPSRAYHCVLLVELSLRTWFRLVVKPKKSTVSFLWVGVESQYSLAAQSELWKSWIHSCLLSMLLLSWSRFLMV